jgi:tetratricopeptide (TPR) repeat protein
LIAALRARCKPRRTWDQLAHALSRSTDKVWIEAAQSATQLAEKLGGAEDNAELLQDGSAALKAFESIGDQRNAAAVRIHLAARHTDLGRRSGDAEQFEVARWLAEQALEYGEEMKIFLTQIQAHRQLGETLAAEGHLKEAYAQLELALELTPAIEDPYVVAYTRKIAGAILRRLAGTTTTLEVQQRQTQEALKLLEAAQGTFESLNVKVELAGIEVERALLTVMINSLQPVLAETG